MRTMRPSIWPQLFYIGVFILEFTWTQQVLSISHPKQTRVDILATKSKQTKFLLVESNRKLVGPSQARQQVSSPRSGLSNQTQPQTTHLTFIGQNDTPTNNNPHTVGQQQRELLRYAVVVDCGSSGTRVQIFHWPANTTDHQHEPGKLAPEFAYRVDTLRNATTGQPLSLRIRPGLASVRDTPDAASDYLAPMLRFASTWVPASEQPRTPVYIMGTAGMRTLAPWQQASILADLERDLTREFAFRPITAEVISGLDEGFYQWLSINTLARRLGPGYAAVATTSSARSRRLGLVEMGGYSAQVAFEASGSQLEALARRRLKHQPAAWRAYEQSSRTIDLAGGSGGPTGIFSISLLGFGSDMARQWAVDLLVRDSLAYLRRAGLSGARGSPVSLDDPCLPRNSHESMVKPTSLLAHAPARTLNYNVQSEGEPTFQVHLHGRGNFVACLSLLNRLIAIARVEQTTCYAGGSGDQRDQSKVCEAPLIGTNFVPWRELQFIGLGELYYTSHEMLRASGRFQGPRIKWEAASICGKSLELINAQYPSDGGGGGTDATFIKRRNLLACFKATWLLAWLSTALRMPMGQVPPTHKWAANAANLTLTKRVDGQEVDWKLGAVLAKTTSIASAGRRWAAGSRRAN